MVLKLNTKVKLKNTGEVGTVVLRTDYLAGYSKYVVELAEAGKDPRFQNVHDFDVEVVSEHDKVPTPTPSKEFPLGTTVAVLPDGQFKGIVTAHSRSSSGCCEYEVTGYSPLKGQTRILCEAPMLKVVQDQQQVQQGAEGGSVTRGITLR